MPKLVKPEIEPGATSRYSTFLAGSRKDAKTAPVSRRSFLQMSAATGAAALPRTSSGTVISRLRFIDKADVIVIEGPDISPWALKKGAFGPGVRCGLERISASCREVQISTTGTKSPDFPTDLRIRFTKEQGRWQVSSESFGARSRGSICAREWLAGIRNLEIDDSGLRSTLFNVDEGGIRLAGSAFKVTLRRDLTLEVRGRNCCSVRYPGVSVFRGDVAELTLISPDGSVLSGVMDGPVLRLSAFSGRRRWPAIQLMNELPAPFSLDCPSMAPKTAQVDFAITDRGQMRAIALKGSPEGTFRIGGPLRGRDGKDSILDINKVSLIHATTGDQTEQVMIASLGDSAGYSFKAAGFEATVAGGELPLIQVVASRQGKDPLHVYVSAPSCGIAIPLPDTFVHVVATPVGSPLKIIPLAPGEASGGPAPVEASSSAGECVIQVSGNVTRLDLSQVRLSVLRAIDFMAMDFTFKNLVLESGWGTSHLVRGDEVLPLPDGTVHPFPLPPGILIANFQAQALREQTTYQDNTDNTDIVPVPPRSDKVQLSQPTRVAFEIPSALLDSKPLFSVAFLLQWEKFALRVDDRARSLVPVGFVESPSLPADDVTSMDFFGLHLSPNERASWRHYKEPLKIGKRVHLYHGLLFDGTGKENTVGLRAIWRTGYETAPNVGEHKCSLGTGGAPPVFSMSGDDQTHIVQLMSDFSLVDQASQHNYVPVAMALDYLCLSALGGSMKGHAAFVAPILGKSSQGDDEGIDIESWTHESAFWRLDLDEIKYRYFAFPFSFRIAIVKKTARAVYKAGNPVDPKLNIACLRTQIFVEWVEPSIEFLKRPLPYAATVQMPFGRIDVDEKAKRSPPIDDPCHGSPLPFQPNPPDPAAAFWPMVDGVPLLLHMIGHDVGGKPGHGNGTSKFAAPFIAVKGTPALRFTGNSVDDAILAGVKKYYRDVTQPEIVPRRTVECHGQYIHYSPVQKVGDSEFQTYDLLFDYDDLPADPTTAQQQLSKYVPRFLPAVSEATVTVPAVEHLTGVSRVAVSYADEYLKYGIRNADGSIPPSNKGQVTLHLLRAAPLPSLMRAKTYGSDRWIATSKGRRPSDWLAHTYSPPGVGMPFPGGKSAGVMSPAITMKGFSPPNGPLGGDISKYALAVMDNVSYFANTIEISAKLIGDLDLANVLPPSIKDITKALAKIPNFIHQALSELTKELIDPLRSVKSRIDTAEKALADYIGALTAPLRTLEKAANSEIRRALVDLGIKLQNKFFYDDSSPYLPAVPAAQSSWTGTQQQLCKGVTCPPATPPAAGQLTGTCAERCAAAPSLQALLSALIDSLQTLTGSEALLQADIQLIIDVFGAAAGSSTGWLTSCAEQIEETFEGVADGDPNPFRVRLLDLTSRFDIGAAVQDLQDIVTTALTILEGNSLPTPDAAAKLQTLTSDIEGLVKVAPTLADPSALLNLVIAPFKVLEQSLGDNFSAATATYSKLADTIITQLTSVIPAQFQGQKQQARDCLTLASKRAQQIILDDVVNAILPAAETIWTNVLNSDVVQEVTQAVQNALSLGDELVSEVTGFVADAESLLNALGQPRLIKVDYTFSPDLQDWPAEKPIFVAQANGSASDLHLKVHIEIPIDPAHPDATKPHVSIDGKLDNFGLVFFPSLEFLRIEFASVTFKSIDGATPDIHVEVSDVSLGSALEFLKAFQSFMNFGGGDNGPYLKLTPQEVQAGFAYFKDEISIGAFFIRNLGFDAHVELSFENGPLIGAFSFAKESRRFNVTYGVYGGGGYFAIRATPSQIDKLSIAIEGGVYSDFSCGGIASGTAQAVIGFVYQKSRQSCEFRGYFDAAANLDVLGLIHAALGFYLGLSYISNGNGSGKSAGTCTITVDIDMCLWTMHVDVTCYREFSSSGGDQKNKMRLLTAANSPQPAVTEVGPGTDNYLRIWNTYESAYL
jgi:hypothetical protein